jgi:membrane fusion protein, heavy metal efflux system
MLGRLLTPVNMAVGVVLVLTVTGGGVAALLARDWWRPAVGEPTPAFRETRPALQLLAKDTLGVPPEAVRSLGLRTAPVRPATQPRPLPPLAGSLALDTNRLVRVHARFAGEVVEVGTVSEREPGSGRTTERSLRSGDRVAAGQLLAVVWSKDLGEKKSELVDAVSRLRLDRETLERLQETYRKGAIAERTVREAERTVEADVIALARAERTLRSWRLTEDEIQVIEAEADRLRQQGHRANAEQDRAWARVEVRAPFAGTVLESNVTAGDIVDTSTTLFQVADLSRLCVWAHAYEEDLPALNALPKPVRWTIRLKADPKAEPLAGTVEKVGDLIDPAQHTALVTGRVDNPDGRMRAGQFITATIEVPPDPAEVEVPTAALVEDGDASVVFVQPDPGKTAYELRRVAVARRYHDVVYVRGGDPKAAPLRPGELVVTSGAVLLKAALEDLRTTDAQDNRLALAGR